LGTGANTIDRAFSKPASDVWEASVKSAESMELCLSSDDHDQFGGELIASRANGLEVRIWVRSMDEKRSRVSVRVEPGDRALALLLYERIAENLGLGEAKAALLGGNSAEGVYVMDLGVAMLTARRTLRWVEVTITDHEPHADWAKIDGRTKDSTPVRIRIDRMDDRKVKITFIAGNERSDDHQAFARRMKDAFDTVQIQGASN
jgi:hypothetical protein